MDIYPTLVEIINNTFKKNIDGISLLKKEAHKYLVFEDSSIFEPYLGIYNNIWRYKESSFSYYLSLKNDYLCVDKDKLTIFNTKKLDENLIETIQKKISIISCSYKNMRKQNDILSFYKNMNMNYKNCNFSDGSKRISSQMYLVYKFFSKLISLFFKLNYLILKLIKNSK